MKRSRHPIITLISTAVTLAAVALFLLLIQLRAPKNFDMDVFAYPPSQLGPAHEFGRKQFAKGQILLALEQTCD